MRVNAVVGANLSLLLVALLRSIIVVLSVLDSLFDLLGHLRFLDVHCVW